MVTVILVTGARRTFEMREMDGGVDSLDSVSLGSPRDHGRLCGVTEIGGLGAVFGALAHKIGACKVAGNLHVVRILLGAPSGRTRFGKLCFEHFHLR